MADQENRGGDGAPGAREEDSVMRVNLAEGCGAVNGETRSQGQSVLIIWSVRSVWLYQTNQIDQIDQTDQVLPARELYWLDAFLYKNDCAGH